MYDVAEDARLETEFALNVVGTTQLPTLVISGTITSEADGTASKQHNREMGYMHKSLSPSISLSLCPSPPLSLSV